MSTATEILLVFLDIH